MVGLLLATALIAAVWALGPLGLLPSWQQVKEWWRLWWHVALRSIIAIGLLAGAVITWRGRQSFRTHPAGPPLVEQPERGGLDWTRITSLITALTALGALLFTALSLSATRDQIYITEQGQLTDRFSKAVEQLGSQGPDLVDVRLGGVYALERIAHDSRNDQPAIIEVLAAFIRNHAPVTEDFRACTEKPVATDVQAALTVLGRRNAQYDANVTIDLNSTCLSGADLTDASLIGVNLGAANLVRARLVRAKLVGGHLDFANVTGADLTGADLTAADLTGAHLNFANFVGAHLAGANLNKADNGDDGADFTDADLTGADLTGAHLVNSHLVRADLTGADLTGVDLTGADLTDARK